MNFEEKINRLNTQQKKAITTLDGPVMVIAGPGTGKTEILSLRIGYILQHTDTPPGSILCLTYTEAAASEMRHRLIAYIGPEAYGIQVNTFHGFCNLVIQENPSLFQQARDLDSISDIDKFRLVKKLIDRFGDDHPLKKFKGQTYSSWIRLLGLFSTMKKENWSPDFVHAMIDDYVERMRNDTEYTYKRKTGDKLKGDFNENKFNTEVLEKMKTLHAAVNEYNMYITLLAEEGKYDYDDMLLWVHEAFSQHPDLLANYQERFLYFLVDEFQDTNGIQINILQQLIDHEWLERPNIFVVGDDDQAIYRFQGANIKNLQDFKDRYNPEIILLEDNYRSSQKILDASQMVIAPIDNSLAKQVLGQPKNLRASGRHADLPQEATIHTFPNMTYENAYIFHALKLWHESAEEGSCAVLYPKHALGADLAFALKGAGIPFQTQRDTDALHQPIVRNLLDILTCLQKLTEGADNDDGLLYRILHLAYLEANPADLQRLMLAYTSKEKTDRSTLFMWMGDPEKLDTIAFKNRAHIDQLFQIINEATAHYHTTTLIWLVEWIVHRFGIMRWILLQPEKFILLYTLKSFYQFIEKESVGKPHFRPNDLIQLCDDMVTYNIRLAVQELAVNPTGIHLSSFHGAKGLEYETVYLKDMTENEWEKKRGANKQFSFPDNLITTENTQDPEAESGDAKDQDLRRLLYVGMTRAKRELHLTYAKKRDEKKSLTPSQYITELVQEGSPIPVIDENLNEDLLAAYTVARMSGQQTADLTLDEEEIKRRVEQYVLNVSALNQYLECPLRFYYEKILMIPSAQKSYLIFGSAMHDALQKYFDRRFKAGHADTGVDFLQWAFEQYMEKEKHRFTPMEFEDQVIYGKRILAAYYQHHVSSWSEAIRYETEYKVRDIHIEGIPVSGFIDRMDIKGNEVDVYDYKTGSPDSFSKKIKPPSEDNEHGGPYWRQMVFYDLMLQQDPRIRKQVALGKIEGLEPNKAGKFFTYKIQITDTDRDIVRDQIKNTYAAIQRQEFQTGCGKCEWCTMHDLNPPIVMEEEFDPEG